MSTHSLRLLAAVAALALLAGACTTTPGAPSPTATPPPGAAGPTATPPPAGTAGAEPAPDPGVFVDTTDVLLLESYPVQVVLHVTGTLPTPCHRLAHDVTDDGSRIDVTLTATTNAEACIQVIAPFDERIALGSFAAGARTVWLNRERVGEFALGAGAGDVSVTPGAPFTLRPGMTATLEGDGTLIRFDGVENDSRCPRDVVCIRAGDATVVLTVTSTGGAPATVRVLVDPGEGVASVDGLHIRVTALTPTPVSTTQIAPNDYAATLVVQR
ncbi:MAG: hypothetical protein WEB13_11205 [Dehalococcoidia bacterium]